MLIVDLPFFAANRARLAMLRPVVRQVNALEAEVSKRGDDELRQSTVALRRRLSQGETLDDLEAEAFALVREAAKRQIGQRHFDVQVMGAAAMHRGWFAEMQTGEGKTLTATMPAFLDALTGRGVHIVTVNDYLAKRDAEWMGNIYRALGLTVGCLIHGLTDAERLAVYQADITYGTNKEFAFDYLRDQLRLHSSRTNLAGAGIFERKGRGAAARLVRVQREHYFAIVDEVDSILIDESRVPLIISEREGEESPYSPAYHAARKVAFDFTDGRDYTVDISKRRVELTNAGIDRSRAVKGIAAPPNRPLEHLIEQALRAEHLFQRDREYLVIDGKVSIVDEFTGRVLPDRTWSLGLHQAIEAKEAVKITEENRTLASVTFQRYFKLYRKLAGMTGTAHDARREFKKVFECRVAVIPTNKPLHRAIYPLRLFATWKEKNEAILERIMEMHAKGRPVLVGTRSVHRSEELSRFLTERGIEHSVLNARNNAEEAEIIAQAGQRGKVMISTNMAGRGVDILLGDGVANLGGLHVLGTELHEASRIDRQLGGRAGRQGDPGSYEFFISMEDEILSRWNKHVAGWLLGRARHGKKHFGRVARLIFEIAQRWIEHRHLRIRLDLIDYDKKLEEMKGHLGVPLWG